MVQQPAHSIIAELEDAVRGGSSAKRVETLRQVTDLFLNDGERLSDDQVKVFDDVLCLLIARVETRAKAELSKRLAPLDYAPFEVIQHLAWDDEIAVAGDVLTHSSRLSTEALVEIASTKGQDHLLAISGRANLPEAVTDVIVDRGEDQGDPQAREQRQRDFPRPAIPAWSPAPKATMNWSRSSAFALDLPVEIPARPVAPRQGRRSRPAAGHRAARAPGRDQAGARRHRARGTAARDAIFGVAEAAREADEGTERTRRRGRLQFRRSRRSSTRSRSRSRCSTTCRSK